LPTAISGRLKSTAGLSNWNTAAEMADLTTIRPANEQDCPVINDIYNYYVDTSTCTYQLERSTAAERVEWFRSHSPRQPIFVAELDGRVVGWASISPFRAREGYKSTVENSVYIHHEFHRRGLGGILLERLIVAATELGYHTIIAGIDGEQTASIRIHEKYGFKTVGILPQVARKFDRWLDVYFMQKMLT
jgi:L-amino acid N-acyltransferase YncA